MKYSVLEDTDWHSRRRPQFWRSVCWRCPCGRCSVLVRPEEGIAGAARRLWRQQLAPGHHCIGQADRRAVPQHHQV